jgi:hypothetical protein
MTITEKTRVSVSLQILAVVMLGLGGWFMRVEISTSISELRAENMQARAEDRAISAGQCLLLKELAAEVAPEFRNRELYKAVDCGNFAIQRAAFDFAELERTGNSDRKIVDGFYGP